MTTLDSNVELLALTRAKSSTLQPNKRGIWEYGQYCKPNHCQHGSLRDELLLETYVFLLF